MRASQTSNQQAVRQDPEWLTAVGVAFAMLLLSSIGLVAAGGWKWFAAFLEGTASGWIQALGSIGAIIFGFIFVDRQNNHQKEREEDQAKELVVRQIQSVVAACLQAREAVAWTRIATEVESLDDATIEPIEFSTEEALAALKSIPFSEIPDGTLLIRSGALRKDLVTLLIHCRATKRQVDRKKTDYLKAFAPQVSDNLCKTEARAADLIRTLTRNQ